MPHHDASRRDRLFAAACYLIAAAAIVGLVRMGLFSLRWPPQPSTRSAAFGVCSILMPTGILAGVWFRTRGKGASRIFLFSGAGFVLAAVLVVLLS